MLVSDCSLKGQLTPLNGLLILRVYIMKLVLAAGIDDTISRISCSIKVEICVITIIY